MAIEGITQPEYIQIDEQLRLRKYDGKHDFAFEWYQDIETVKLVDGVEKPYSQETLDCMYNYLNQRGELYFIEALEDDIYVPIGDVTFWQEDMPIVIGDKKYRGKGVGGKVVCSLIQRGRELGYDTLYVGEIYDFNEGSRRCFEKCGFVAYEVTEKGKKYRLELKKKARNILVTGGTVFVSRYVAEYFVKKGDKVFVLNRNNRPQSAGVTLIEADRNKLGDKLKDYHFDVVLDVTAYTKTDVENLVNALGEIKDYIFISSSAVYPETLPQPFCEEQECGPNRIWGAYGTNKLEAEKYLQATVPQAYILRPPYLYGPMQNVYREPFVFDCAMADRTFCIPKDGSMKLQFFHVEDLCRFIETLLEKKPKQRIFNVGNREAVSINEWVALCYQVAGKELHTMNVDNAHQQRQYFCFYDYEYYLDVTKQESLMPDTKPLYEGLQESYAWYRQHEDLVNKKPLLEYIEKEIFLKHD